MAAFEATVQPPARCKTVCIVEDDAPVRDSLSVLLEIRGLTVLAYESAADFLADQGGRRAGCLIVDQNMPGMSGLELLAALRANGNPVPAIILTGRSSPHLAQRAPALGVVAILEKPLVQAALTVLVCAILKQGG